MAVNIRTPGAAPSGGVARVDPFALAADFGKHMGYTQAPNPAQSILDTVNAVPQLPQAPPIDPTMFAGQETPINTPEDVARLSNSPYVPAAEMQPVMDENTGLPVLNPDGTPQMQPITMDQYQQEAEATKAGFAQVLDPIRRIANDPFNSQDAIRDILQVKQTAAENQGNARYVDKHTLAGPELNQIVDTVGSDLGIATKNMERALFSQESRSVVAEDDIGRKLPAGLAVFSENGIADIETARVVSTIGAAAFNQMVAQIGVAKKTEVKGEEEKSNAPEGTEYMTDSINAMTSFFKNGLRNIGMKNIKGEDAEFMAKAAIHDAIARGDLTAAHDPAGRPIIEASRDLKSQAMRLQRVADAMTGVPTRRSSSTTPTPTGVGFAAGGPRLTARSVYSPQFVTNAANITKNILGSVAFVFRKKDYDRKVKELELVFHPDFMKMDPRTGDFMYSTHPFAKRNGVDENAYNTAKARHKPTQGMDFNDPRAQDLFEIQAEEAARKVMATKKADIEFTMKSLLDKTGLRYGSYMHSLSNQRFYINSYDLDYMGSKNIIRDILGLAYQDTVRVDTLFDSNPLGILKRKANWVFSKDGKETHKNLTSLNPNELGALGAIYNATMFYYTAINKDIPGIAKLPQGQVIDLYTPEVGEALADLGQKYNAWLADPTQEMDGELASIWAAAEKGEGLGTFNLLDDFARAKEGYLNPASKRGSIALSHHGFYDGNQNGIFLQSLFFGQRSQNERADGLIRLGAGNPSLSDMRVHGMNIVLAEQKKFLDQAKDKPELREAWDNFWAAAIKNSNGDWDSVAKDFFKAPLMQAAYGKDASMFTDVLFEMMEGNSTYSDLVREHLLPVYGNAYAAASDLSHSVEQSLRQVIDSGSVWMMKRIGRNFALLNTPMVFQGITSDSYVISPMGIVPVNKSATTDNSTVISQKTPDGQTYFLKKPQRRADEFKDPETGEVISIDSTRLGFNPTFSKGQSIDPTGMKNTMRYLNRSIMKYDEFHNPLGTSMASQAAVLTIQSLDGDLVKWTTIEANKGLKIPRPVMWVHDSIISTPGQALIYTNVYNNIAIPGAINEIKKIGGKIDKALKDARKRTNQWVEANNAAIGIGSEGEFGAIGALFDEIVDRYLSADDSYMNHYLRQRMAQGKSPEQAKALWDKKVKEADDIINEAKKFGYVDPLDLSGPNRKYMAVPPKAFPHLLALAEGTLMTNGAQNRLPEFLGDWERRVTNAERTLLTAATHGITQMGGSAHKMGKPLGRPVKKTEKLPDVPKAKPVEVPKDEQLVPPVPFPKEVPFNELKPIKPKYKMVPSKDGWEFIKK
jgi:hypothetical protein